MIGGAALFAAMMPRADRLAMTFVDAAPDADTFFPPIDPSSWREVGRDRPPRREDDDAGCVFVEYRRDE